MKFALHNNERVTANKELQQAIRDGASQAVCPNPDCSDPMIPKCGEIYTWHWAHKSGHDCDDWGEPETQWHREWKDRFPEDCQEVIIRGSGKWEGVVHRADVAIPGGPVIEFQHSSLSADQIREREDFYTDNWGSMVWVVDGSEFMDRWESLGSRGDWLGSPSEKQADEIVRSIYQTPHRPKEKGDEGYDVYGETLLPDTIACDSPELLHSVCWPHARKQWAYALCQVYFDSGRRDNSEEENFLTVIESERMKNVRTQKRMEKPFTQEKYIRREIRYRDDVMEITDDRTSFKQFLENKFAKLHAILGNHPKIASAPRRKVKYIEGIDDPPIPRSGEVLLVRVVTQVTHMQSYWESEWHEEEITRKSHEYSNSHGDVFEWVGAISSNKYGRNAKIVPRESVHLPKYMAGRYRPFNDVLADLSADNSLPLAA